MRNLNKSMRNANYERYTPPILVEPIIQFFQKDWTVWCPFDTDDSEFVIQLRRNGNRVIATHIWNGQDFFAYEPEHYDCIISNRLLPHDLMFTHLEHNNTGPNFVGSKMGR